MSDTATPAGGKVLTRSYFVLVVLSAIAIGLIGWRLLSGLGATTGMSDGYPWGIWIAFDVVTGTAIACGGYAMALVVYFFNKGKYHPLIRPAILTSALGYTIAGLSVAIDVGRPWLLWKVPLFFWKWNLNSVLLEVALCIMAYVVVLWIELAPAFLEKWRDDPSKDKLATLAEETLPILNKSLIWIAAIGIWLPTMHQSSLGTLMLISGPRLHPLWNSPILPLLFLITALGMGYALVVFESIFSSRTFGKKPEKKMLFTLQTVAAWSGVVYVVLRVGDLVIRGDISVAFLPVVQDRVFLARDRALPRPDVLCSEKEIRSRQSVPWRHVHRHRRCVLQIRHVPARLRSRARMALLSYNDRNPDHRRFRRHRDRCLHRPRQAVPHSERHPDPTESQRKTTPAGRSSPRGSALGEINVKADRN